MKQQGIGVVSHYVPLHSSPAGKKYGRCGSAMSVTDIASSSLIRLPLWVGIKEKEQVEVVEKLQHVIFGDAYS